MDLLIPTRRGNVVTSTQAQAVDHLLELHRSMDQMEFIDRLIQIWATLNPELYKSYHDKATNTKYRGNNMNKYSASKDLGMRRVADIPRDLYDLIDFFYPGDLRNRKWVVKFVKRFPQFRYADSNASL